MHHGRCVQQAGTLQQKLLKLFQENYLHDVGNLIEYKATTTGRSQTHS